MRTLIGEQRAVAAAELALNPTVLTPPGWGGSLARLFLREDVIVMRSGNALIVERGASFAADWVREVWVGGRVFPDALPALRQLLAGRATHLRFFLPESTDPRILVALQRFRARAIAARDGLLVYQIDRADRVNSARPEPVGISRHRGFSIASARWDDVALLERWWSRPDVREALGFGDGVAPKDIRAYLFPPNEDRYGGSPVLVHMIRVDGRSVGFAVEYDWAYPNDVVREFDLALLDVKRPLFKVARIVPALIDSFFRRGGHLIIFDMRSGVFGAGFPRLLKKCGGDDITDKVASHWRPMPGRVFYGGTAKQFYSSKIGSTFARGIRR